MKKACLTELAAFDLKNEPLELPAPSEDFGPFYGADEQIADEPLK